MNHRTEILDLRTALEVLRETPGQLVETNVEVNPQAELSGVYRYVGAGGTVMRPTQVDGPAMVFHNVKGHPGASVAIGVLASRARVANLFGCKKEELGHLVQSCAANPIQPVVTEGPAPCQEEVHLASDPDFDLFRLIPAPTNTPVDAGPYITLGMCYATHPDTGRSDVTIHRMCIQSRDELSIFLQPGSRHIGAMAERATELGQPLPISVSIGVDPAIEVLSFVAENERTNIRQRQAEGIAAAKAKGVKFGRPSLPLPDNFYELHKAWRTKKLTLKQAAAACNMPIGTFYGKARKFENVD